MPGAVVAPELTCGPGRASTVLGTPWSPGTAVGAELPGDTGSRATKSHSKPGFPLPLGRENHQQWLSTVLRGISCLAQINKF